MRRGNGTREGGARPLGVAAEGSGGTTYKGLRGGTCNIHDGGKIVRVHWPLYTQYSGVGGVGQQKDGLANLRPFG